MTHIHVHSPWPAKYRTIGWALFAIFMVAFVLFFVSYVGNSWYVVPIENNNYPPDNPVPPFNFGLFYLCYRGHCKYDLRQDYVIVKLLEGEKFQGGIKMKEFDLGITWAYQNYRVVCMAIESVAAILCIITIGLYLFHLAGYGFSHFIGYATAGIEILAGVISLIGVIIFGKQFRGKTAAVPFGWSFGLIIVAFVILILNGIATAFATLSIQRYQSSSASKSALSGDTQPLTR